MSLPDDMLTAVWVCPACGIQDDNECAYGGWHGTQPFAEPGRFPGALAVLVDVGAIEQCGIWGCPWPEEHRGAHGHDDTNVIWWCASERRETQSHERDDPEWHSCSPSLQCGKGRSEVLPCGWSRIVPVDVQE